MKKQYLLYSVLLVQLRIVYSGEGDEDIGNDWGLVQSRDLHNVSFGPSIPLQDKNNEGTAGSNFVGSNFLYFANRLDPAREPLLGSDAVPYGQKGMLPLDTRLVGYLGTTSVERSVKGTIGTNVLKDLVEAVVVGFNWLNELIEWLGGPG